MLQHGLADMSVAVTFSLDGALTKDDQERLLQSVAAISGVLSVGRISPNAKAEFARRMCLARVAEPSVEAVVAGLNRMRGVEATGVAPERVLL